MFKSLSEVEVSRRGVVSVISPARHVNPGERREESGNLSVGVRERDRQREREKKTCQARSSLIESMRLFLSESQSLLGAILLLGGLVQQPGNSVGEKQSESSAAKSCAVICTRTDRRSEQRGISVPV